jgi:hypothetical protein
MKIALVTDSACDLPSDLVSTYQVHVVPNILIMDGISVEDNKDFSRRDFYLQLPDMETFPTTSTASIGTYQALYEQLIDDGYDRIISIHVSQVLSGIFNAASTAAQPMEGRVTVIDSQQVSLGLGFQILEAAEEISCHAGHPGIYPPQWSRLLGKSKDRCTAQFETIRRSQGWQCQQPGRSTDAQKGSGQVASDDAESKIITTVWHATYKC